MKYLVDKFSHGHVLYPQDLQTWASIDRLLDFDLGQLYPAIRAFVLPQTSSKKPLCHDLEDAMKKTLDKLEMFLRDRSYLMGDVTSIADHSVCGTVSALFTINYDTSSWKNIHEWLARCKARPYCEECTHGGYAWQKLTVSHPAIIDELPEVQPANREESEKTENGSVCKGDAEGIELEKMSEMSLFDSHDKVDASEEASQIDSSANDVKTLPVDQEQNDAVKC